MSLHMSDARIDKWTRWIDGPIKNAVLTLYHRRQIWRGLAEVIKAHASLPDSSFWQYHLDLYATTQAAAIRRQADLGPGVASLAKLLTEVSGDAGRITRQFWIGLWSDPSDKSFARRQWDDVFGGTVGTHLDPAITTADLQRLQATSASVKTFVDKHIAHSDQGAKAAKASLSVADLDLAIDTLATYLGDMPRCSQLAIGRFWSQSSSMTGLRHSAFHGSGEPIPDPVISRPGKPVRRRRFRFSPKRYSDRPAAASASLRSKNHWVRTHRP